MKTLASAPDLHELQQRLAALTTTDQRRWGRMSAAQMVCHLRDALSLALGELPATPVKGPLPPPALKWLALSSPMPWPKGVATVLELASLIAAAEPAAFTTVQHNVACKLNQLAIARENTPDHPFFGSMTHRDWLRWGYLHADHHLRQFGR